MSRAFNVVLALLEGAAVGVATAVSFTCIQHWYWGGSGDPRCVFLVRHYVEVFTLEHGGIEKITCRYEPNFRDDVAPAE